MISRIDRANAIRMLSIDAIQKANSGHPGAPMGMADIAEVLWHDYLKHNPNNPNWYNRDRFILSNGHGSMLIYALLHLTGYQVSLDDLKQFRQLQAITPGHPELGETPGIETTTGPLGQGLANGIGMALAEKLLATRFNQDNDTIIDHKTYVFLGDGCMMEGISHEAASLAGTWKLGKLITFYDDNGISIDGKVHQWFTDDTTKRFESYGWQVLPTIDGHDPVAITQAIEQAIACSDQPSLIPCKTIIGFGSPNKAGTAACHGAPLGDHEIQLVRKKLNWSSSPFDIPESIAESWNAQEKGTILEKNWEQQWQHYQSAYPELAQELKRRLNQSLPEDFSNKASQYIKSCQENLQDLASRQSSQKALDAYAPHIPELIGGSADLTGSNLTLWKNATPMNSHQMTAHDNYLFYGVREFGMTAIANGVALHGGFIPYIGTFLVFTDYARNAVRMSALMKLHLIYIYTHDSIGLGEDGPTHQPIEQLAALRMTPGLHTWRPCDHIETAVAWKHALQHQKGPSALVLSRQKLPAIPKHSEQLTSIEQGAYILIESEKTPELILIATGSEVHLATQAQAILTQEGYAVRVVSMPCNTLFDQQSKAYQDSVLPASITNRIAIEAAHQDFWYKYVGLSGQIIGMHTFGASAPAKQLFDIFGFSVENIINISHQVLKKT
ncbi:MAG: transketolase [Endozoicomonadaceae bacterium]|nr:transketolase [Endozoicomonadaceae bacterium]